MECCVTYGPYTYHKYHHDKFYWISTNHKPVLNAHCLVNRCVDEYKCRIYTQVSGSPIVHAGTVIILTQIN